MAGGAHGGAAVWAIFERTVKACVAVGIAKGEVVCADASRTRADIDRESLVARHLALQLRFPVTSESVTGHGIGDLCAKGFERILRS